MSVKSYIETNKGRFLEELFGLMRIPSISALEEHKPDMLACAQRLANLLMASGATGARITPTAGNPIVYADRYWSMAITT